MAYTETTTTSYGSRLGGSLKGMFSGLLLFFAATALLWWNEGRAVKQSDAIKDAEKNFVEMENPGKLDPALDGELVYACALATTEDVLEDSEFGVKANAINMKREVEYYQWIEESHSESKDKLGGSQETTTTYTYKLGWTNAPQNSSNFRDPQYQGKNTVLVEVEDASWASENVTFGAYTLPDFIIANLSANEKLDVEVSESDMLAWERRFNPNAVNIAAQNNAMVAEAQKDTALVKQDSVETPKMTINTEFVHVGGNQIYLGRNPSQPNVGDVRISYKKCSPTKCSLIAKVKGDTFAKYKAKNGKMFYLVSKGVEASDEMIQGAKDANTTMTWILRIIGLILIYTSLRMLLGFPEMLLKVVPFLSSILGIGVGIVCFLLTVVWGGLIIALAWLFYRPILSICILVVAGAAGFALWKYKKSKKAAEPAPAPANNAPQA